MFAVFFTSIRRIFIFPKHCIQEKSVENKSFSKLNVKIFFISTLFFLECTAYEIWTSVEDKKLNISQQKSVKLK